MSARKISKVSANSTAVPLLVSSHDIQRVRAEMSEKYGMEVSDQFAADLVAFVDSMTATQQANSNGN